MHGQIINLVSLVLLTCAGVTTISCTGGQPAGPKLFSSASASRSASSADSAANDYTKPYLSDEKVKKLIDSMKEEHNPFEVIFKAGGQMRNPLDVASKMEELNSSARKYGFADYRDYTAVWGRVVAGEMQLLGEETFQKMISDAQAELKKPDLSPEMKKIYEDQIASSQKTLDEMHNPKSGSGLNAADLGLVKRYKDQIDQAQEKYKTGQ
jgi:hypothetical protein